MLTRSQKLKIEILIKSTLKTNFKEVAEFILKNTNNTNFVAHESLFHKVKDRIRLDIKIQNQ